MFVERRVFLRNTVSLCTALTLISGCRNTLAEAKRRLLVVEASDSHARSRIDRIKVTLAPVASRFTQDVELLPTSLSDDLVARRDVFARLNERNDISVVLAPNPVSAAAVNEWNKAHVGKELPIIFASHEHPSALGFARALDRPDGWMSGIYLSPPYCDRKRLETIRELFPKIQTLGYVLEAYSDADAAHRIGYMRQAVQQYGMELVVFPMKDLERSINDIRSESQNSRIQAWLVHELFDDFARGYPLLKHLVDSGQKVFSTHTSVLPLGVIATLEPIIDAHPIWARQIELVLSGYPIGEIPIELPTRFKRGVNIDALAKHKVSLSKTALATFDHFVNH